MIRKILNQYASLKAPIGSLGALLLIFLTSCYKENDVVADLWENKGLVPNISVWAVGITPGFKTTTSVTVAPSGTVNLYLQYFAPTGIEVKELRLFQRIGATTAPTTPLTTIPGNTGKFDQQARQLVLETTLTAPATRNATMTVFIDPVGSNDLVGARRTVTIRTTP
ncbi:MAG: hypothetical protein ACK4GN_02985 [Runella sp.]